jgi:electron transfer flavoprotein beta subunit
MLNIIACIKVVTDPEAPTSTFKLDPEGQHVIPGPGVPPVLNPYDENCLEAALKIKEAQPVKITVMSMGREVPKAVIKKSLAVGADELVLLEDELFEGVDSCTAAVILARAIEKIGEYDLILTGRMAADTNAGQVGLVIADLLGIPAVAVARKIEVNENIAKIEQVTTDGYQIIKTTLPCLVTISHEIGDMRSATVKGLIAAQKQPFTSWKAPDLGIESGTNGRSKRLKMFIPEKNVIIEMITGDTLEESGENLAERVINLTNH